MNANDTPLFQDIRHTTLMQITMELYRRVFAEQAPEVIHDWLTAEMKRIQPAPTDNLATSWLESFLVYDEEIDRRLALAQLPEAERNLFKWPWSSWNKYLDPAEGGMLIVLAGPDGAGKTTYAECIGEHWAHRGQKVVFVHFELSTIIMLDRRAVRHTAIARRKLKLAGELTQADLDRLEEAKQRLLAWPGEITYLHTPGKTIELILRELDRYRADNQCDAVIVDYIEKAAASSAQLKEYGSQMFAREGADVELLKSWSEKNNVPTLILSQFNKAGKHSDVSDLDRTMIRGAGEKTAKANEVILLQPDRSKPGLINVKIDKNTMGDKGKFQQFFDGANFSVGDVTP